MSDSILFIFKSFMCAFVFWNVIQAGLELLIIHASTFKFQIQMLGIEGQGLTHPAPPPCLVQQSVPIFETL